MITIGLQLDGKYRVTRRLGGGGFGEVFLADDIEIPHRHVAIKVLAKVDDGDQSDLVHEMRALAVFDHPHVVTFYLLMLGVRGFQWLGGSFVEDIEAQESRDPHDVDAVTFVTDPAAPAALAAVMNPHPEVWNPALSKARYMVDHYLASLGSAAVLTVQNARYWYALFSHRRDRVWKGMLVIPLLDRAEDDAARLLLGSKP